MKLKLLAGLMGLGALGFITQSNKTGPAALRGDLTGSPNSTMTCATCHSAGTDSTTTTVTVKKNGIPVTEYQIGDKLRVTISVSGIGTGSRRSGCQAVALNKSDNSDAGTMVAVGAGTKVTTANSRSYYEHSQSSAFGSFAFDWTATAGKTGDTTVFYIAGLDADGNGTSTGNDNYSTTSITLTKKVVSSSVVTVDESSVEALSIFPNPSNGDLVLHGLEGAADVTVHDLSGRTVFSQSLELSLYTALNLDVATGVYVVRVQQGQKVHNQKFIVK